MPTAWGLFAVNISAQRTIKVNCLLADVLAGVLNSLRLKVFFCEGCSGVCFLGIYNVMKVNVNSFAGPW